MVSEEASYSPAPDIDNELEDAAVFSELDDVSVAEKSLLKEALADEDDVAVVSELDDADVDAVEPLESESA